MCVCDFSCHIFSLFLLVRMQGTLTCAFACKRTEYGTANRISTKGDVYSYGMLILEMFTGKRPTDDIFGEDMNLRKYVETNFPERVLNVADARLLSWEVNGPDDAARVLECISSLLRIGLLCSSELSACRPEMRDVIRNLREIREHHEFLLLA